MALREGTVDGCAAAIALKKKKNFAAFSCGTSRGRAPPLHDPASAAIGVEQAGWPSVTDWGKMCGR